MPEGIQPSRRTFLAATGATAASFVLPALPAFPVAAAAAAALADGPGTDAARSAIRRLAPLLADRFALRIAPSAGPAAFTFRAVEGAVEITGTDTSSLLSGFTWYLEQHAHGQVSRGGDQLPARLPLPAAPVTRTTELAHRYAYNFCVMGYTNPNWSWSQWERELDLLAAGGVNELLVTTGMEVLWYDTWRQFGYTGAEALRHISLPCHQPWQWMSNLFGSGGGVSTGLLAKRVELGSRILTRLGELGITPVAPGFSGSVPNGFAARHPGAHVVEQGQWYGYERPDWLDSTDPLFQEVAAVWYAAQRERFGLLHAQAIDLLHEGGQSGGVDLTEAGLGIERSLKASVPDYRWYVQAWGSNPRRELLAALDRTRVLVLDLTGGRWQGSGQFSGTEWTWGQLTNYGGRTGLYGPLAPTANLPALAANPGADKLAGTCMVNEGVDTNPVWGTLFAEAHWHDRPIDLTEWITAYPLRRYGRRDEAAESAWRTLQRTCYSSTVGGGGPDSLFNAQPSLSATRAAPNAPQSLGYAPDALHPAFQDLLRAAEGIGHTDTYRWDLVNVARQALVDRARVLLPRLKTAYEARDVAEFDQSTAEWLTLMDALDRLLATRGEFLVGRWIADARRWGADDAERDALEEDARTLLTTWGETRAAATVNRDYANRDWAGLVGAYYKPRWRRYFTALRAALVSGSTPETVDWYAYGEAFRRDRTPFPVQPSGDPLDEARAVAALLHPQPQLTAVLAPGRPVPGLAAQLTATLANWRPTPLEPAPALDLPDGWSAEPAGWEPGDVPTVKGYDRATYTWRVTPPADTPDGTEAVVTVYAGGVRTELTARVQTPAESLAAAYGNSGISADAQPQYARFDGTNGFSAEALAAAGLPAGAVVERDGLTFRWPDGPPEAPDNVAGAATIRLDAQGSRLGFLGAGVFGQTGAVTVVYTDGTAEQHDVYFPNWAGREPLGGAELVAECGYRLTASGPANHGYGYRVFYNSVPLDPARRVALVSLPDNPRLHVFAMAAG
ncbi:alpha-N-acetylglucosaminidase TIM-barrel domain-containing protein [Streptomyces sp. NPDC051940]|uniref:alpha-N-acetylglucosaminidase TIM-barrel domain-containing protein n=1 Tax=Streptomyces sp. NPDC051940 TaxID=3155675 RepID=UPI003439BA9C